MPLDLSLTTLYRINGQEQATLPGFMAAMPPRKSGRGREQDRLVVYLLLTGTTSFATGEYMHLASRAAVSFYETPGALTSALRAAAGSINKPLLERNMSTSARGLYAVGLLALVALREAQATLLLSGPMHAYVLGNAPQHIFDTLSGKGLGVSQTTPYYFSQLTLQPNDRLLFCGRTPPAWDTTLADKGTASLEATRRRLMNLTGEDVNAVLLQALEGEGSLTVLRPLAEAAPPASEGERAGPPGQEPVPQPSAYAIPAQTNLEPPIPPEPADVLISLPRLRSSEPVPEKAPADPHRTERPVRRLSPRTRRAAKTLANGMQAWRLGLERVGAALQRFIPRLLPGATEKSFSFSASAMVFIAVLIPLMVVTVASVVYFRYGRSVQYEEYLIQAQEARTLALSLSDPAAQREAWQRELFYLDKAEAYSDSAETRALRQEAQVSLDQLLGIARLQFQPVLSKGIGAQISRLAASENDLYLLNAEDGDVLHTSLTSGGFEQDSSFNCSPGAYGGYSVGPLVDILAMPTVNTINATMIGVDAAGILLYCAPGQVALAIPLPPPDTNWGRVTAFTLDANNLYVLDAPARAVWVYAGKSGSGAFVDRPYFFFGGQIPDIQDAIDLAVSGDDLYILHANGRLSTCSYSRIETVPTRCENQTALVNPFPAYRDIDLFAQSHFTQMMFTPAPDSAILILDADSQGVFRFTPRSLELQNQLRPYAGRANPLPQGPVGAMTVSPNHVLYFAVQDKVYFATDAP